MPTTQRRRQLVAMHPRRRIGEPLTKAELLPVLRSHQEHLGSLDEERSQVTAAALGDATQDGASSGAVLAGHQAEPGTEVSAAIERFTGADGSDDGGRDQRPDAGHAHHTDAVDLALADLLDLLGDCLNALVEPKPVSMETDDQIAHARRDLVLAVLENIEQRVAQCARSRPNGDALLDEEGPDLVVRCRPSRHQSAAHPVAGLQIQLLLALLPHRAQFGPQSRFCNSLGVVVVVLLALHERLHIDRRDDARLVTKLAKGTADEMGAEARLHADDEAPSPACCDASAAPHW